VAVETILYTTCKLADCGGPVKSRGAMHYQRWYRTGDPEVVRKGFCKVAGCNEQTIGRGWCGGHDAQGLRDYMRAWNRRRRAKPGYRERELADTRARRAANRRKLTEYKLTMGCIDCGFTEHPAALEFDHVRGKKTAILARAVSWSEDRMWAEVDKCEVRCANCHRIRTAENAGWPDGS
jgi:hypothetical protein